MSDFLELISFFFTRWYKNTQEPYLPSLLKILQVSRKLDKGIWFYSPSWIKCSQPSSPLNRKGYENGCCLLSGTEFFNQLPVSCDLMLWNLCCVSQLWWSITGYIKVLSQLELEGKNNTAKGEVLEERRRVKGGRAEAERSFTFLSRSSIGIIFHSL